MKSRFILLFILICSLGMAVLLRAIFLQVLPNHKLADLKKRQFETVVTLESRRGKIMDRTGRELAVSVPAYSIYADPKMVDEPKKASLQIAKILGLKSSEIYNKLKDHKKRFVWLQRRVADAEKKQIQNLVFSGISFVEESKRVYPNDQLLANVLGFVSREGVGLEGVELKLQGDLSGEAKKVSLQKDARGRPLVVNGQLFHEQPDGWDVQLTIDLELQYRLEQELMAAKQEHEAQSATGVILDAKTSEILAMASVPSFNANQAGSSAPELRRNRCVTDSFEPGSTMKTFIVAAGLREQKINPNTKFFCENGKFKIGKRVIREADAHHNFDWLTVSEILAYSSNIGTTKIAMSLGDENIRRTLLDFGFFKKATMDFASESRGHLPELPWREHLLSNISFGHGVAVTAVQIANAYAAIANGGVLHKPYLVKQISNFETAEKKTFQPSEVHRVLSENDAATLRTMLEGVTNGKGTGLAARVAGYPVAGKTGTAQKVDSSGKYSHENYLASFAGFVPANDPRFVIFIAVDEPHKKYYGAEVAAPVFSKIASYAIRKSGMAPTLVAEQDQYIALKKQKGINTKLTKMVENTSDKVPNWQGMSVKQVLQDLQTRSVSVNFAGAGVVSETIPAAGEPLPQQKAIQVILKAAE